MDAGTGTMPVLLLLLGLVTTAAGLVLAASGVTIHDGGLNSEFLIPGTIAAVGGLLLIGMAPVVGELRRIRGALAAQPTQHPVRAAEAPANADQAPDTVVRFPFPPLKADSPPTPSGANGATSEDAALENLRVRFPSLGRLENGPVTPDAAPSVQGLGGVEEGRAKIKDATGVGRGANGAAVARETPAPDTKARPTAAPAKARGSMLNAIWPAVRREAGAASARVAVPAVSVAPSPPAPAAQQFVEPSAVSGPATESVDAAPASILKSGVVEGMAYTLYSDGSIEARLPQGTLRFGSIAALRNHIESAS